MQKEHLNRFEKEGESMLNRIVAIDKTWIRSYEPELKSVSRMAHSESVISETCKIQKKTGKYQIARYFRL